VRGTDTLALTAAHRAMAEAGLKNMDDADWYWHVALSMDPKLAKNAWSRARLDSSVR
jgi:hypothetical protein